jgi:plasmid stabilization system protein ParE
MLEVIVSKRAQADISDIKAFTAEHWGTIRSSETARTLKNTLHFLSEFPDCGQPVERKDVHVRVVAQLPFVILYRRNEKTITVVRIMHNKRKR